MPETIGKISSDALTNIANAIRARKSTEDTFQPSSLATEVESIKTEPVFDKLNIHKNGSFVARENKDGIAKAKVEIYPDGVVTKNSISSNLPGVYPNNVIYGLPQYCVDPEYINPIDIKRNAKFTDDVSRSGAANILQEPVKHIDLLTMCPTLTNLYKSQYGSNDWFKMVVDANGQNYLCAGQSHNSRNLISNFLIDPIEFKYLYLDTMHDGRNGEWNIYTLYGLPTNISPPSWSSFGQTALFSRWLIDYSKTINQVKEQTGLIINPQTQYYLPRQWVRLDFEEIEVEEPFYLGFHLCNSYTYIYHMILSSEELDLI